MEIYKNGVNMNVVLDQRSLYEAYPDMDLDISYSMESFHEYFATEGILWDSAKGVTRAAKQVKKMGNKGYAAAKSQYRSMKDKWNKIKPMIIKAIKDMGITLSNMYGRFMKYDKDFMELGSKIRNVINVKVPLLGQTKTEVFIDMYNINIDTLSNVCKMIESYEGFVAIVKNEATLLDKSFIEPKDFFELVKKHCNPKTGEFNAGAVEERLNVMINAVGRLNEKGETTIPNEIWTSRKWYVPFNIPKMANRNKNREHQKDMDNSTAAGFTKLSITGTLEELTFEPGSLDKLKDLLVKPNNTGYLNIMESFLNNKVVESTLKKSGSSVKSETKRYFSDLDKMSNEFEQLSKKMFEAKANYNKGRKIDETIDPSAELAKKTLKNSNDGMMDDNASGLDTVIESYFQAMTSFFMTTASVYSSMTSGLLAASFDITVNCKNIVDKIDNLTNIPKTGGGGV